MLDADMIYPGIWQGSYPPPGPEVAKAGFSALVLAARERQPHKAFPGVLVIHAPLDDGILTGPDAGIALGAAREVAAIIRRGGPRAKILVSCNQGRNRSGLVVALALVDLLGVSGAEAARLVRARRRAKAGPALANTTFLQRLLTIPARRRASGAGRAV